MSNELIINGIDLNPQAEWDATWEERIDGVGQASVTVQDRDGDLDLDFDAVYSDRSTILMKVNGSNVFHGEITRGKLDLPPGRPWRRWQLTGSDYNTVLDLRLIGAADGYSWETIDGGRTHRAIDPYGHGEQYDDTTVQAVFDHYVRKPDPDGGGAFDTSTYVFRYIPRKVVWDTAVGKSRLYWTNSTVRSALDELRGLAGFPLFYWIDPDDAVHWVAFPDPITEGLMRGTLLWPGPAPHQFDAPAIITDVTADINGTTVIGGRGLSVDFDETFSPQRVYVVGVTDFVYGGGATNTFHGTGWRDRSITGPTHRQLLVDAQAITKAQRNAVATRYQHIGYRARIKGSITVGTPSEAVDGWRCGQLLTIIDARLPPGVNGLSWPIQRVSGSLKAGNDFRVYTLEFGDAPLGRFSEKYRTTPAKMPTRRLPANRHVIRMPPVMRPSSTYTITGQMVDHSGKSIRQGGVPVDWQLVARDVAGNVVSQGSVTAITDTTDRNGTSAATLTTGAAAATHYHVACNTIAQT